jgi:uncharacterized protein (DUF2235 family)
MARNIVICCDGTDNQFGVENSNVVRLVQSLERDPTQQFLYYDAGIGTFPDPQAWNFLTLVKQKVANLADRMMAWRLEKNVEEAYAYLMDFWEPEDKVFLFGFSRGAYTVRVLAGMLHVMGLLPRGNYNMLPYVTQLYRSVRGKTPGQSSKGVNYWKLCSDFRGTFARETPDRNRRFSVHFLGVWDTVATVGWLWNPATYPHTRSNPGIRIVRHAVSIDERRAFFRQNLFKPKKGQDVQELWFPGDHSDIGGGHPENEGGLWRVSFLWMLEQAAAAGLQTNADRLTKVLRGTSPADPWAEKQHSLLAKWWLAELVPKRQWQWATSTYSWRCGRFGHRFVPIGSMIHESAMRRLRSRTLDYDPPNLSTAFKEQVKNMPMVTASAPSK